VLGYKEFQVLDAKSGENLTRAILLQIILEEESGGVPMFSTDMLANIIRYYGHSMQGLMGSYLERSINAFHEAQKRFQAQAQVLIPTLPADAFANLMTGAPPIPQVMGGYLEKGAKAVIDMQDELRSQALKLFSGFPYAAAPGEAAAPETAAGKPKHAPRPAARKPRSKKK
jgi:polyhydroxyalkanoate synthesis repressor PhaR